MTPPARAEAPTPARTTARRADAYPMALRPRHDLPALSNAVVTTMLVLRASPPPLSLFLQGCFPFAMRASAMLPAGVGPRQGRRRFLARRLPHAPQRVQNAMGTTPEAIAILCPLALHSSARACAMWPLHLSAICLSVRLSPRAQVPQFAHLHNPSLNCQKCCSATRAASGSTGLRLLSNLWSSAGGNMARATPIALAISGARRV